MKTCTRCGELKPESEFYANRAQCKPCRVAVVVAHQRTPAGKATMRRAQLMHRYGITQGEYEARLEAQGGRCAICGSSTSRNPRSPHFSVDHDHETEEVRGLLCHRCNNALGWLDEHMAAVLAYLARPADTSS